MPYEIGLVGIRMLFHFAVPWSPADVSSATHSFELSGSGRRITQTMHDALYIYIIPIVQIATQSCSPVRNAQTSHGQIHYTHHALP